MIWLEAVSNVSLSAASGSRLGGCLCCLCHSARQPRRSSCSGVAEPCRFMSRSVPYMPWLG